MTEICELEATFDRLWPLLRSITGEGVRQTHDILGELIPLERHEVPTGTEVLDWTVPKEWVVRGAYVIGPDGDRILDVRENNLHLVNYSVPFRGRLSREELNKHLYSMPELPDAIPYITRYYKPEWGFCLSQRQRDHLPAGEYEIVVDTDHIEGSLTFSECVLPGDSKDEILVHTYTCHPSLANNELSGPLVTAFLARRIARRPRRFTYRFVFAPESIGAVTFLALRGEHLRKYLRAGLIATCVGDNGPFTYKRSRQGNSLTDRAVDYVFARLVDTEKKMLNFSVSGSDERQYCSPGFNFPVGSLMRTKYGDYPEYHTSLDNKDLISFNAIIQTIDVYEALFEVIEKNKVYRTLKPYGEPQLSKYVDFYGTSGHRFATRQTMAAKWCIHYCDGAHDLLSIAELSGMDIVDLHDVAQVLAEAGLFEEVGQRKVASSPDSTD